MGGLIYCLLLVMIATGMLIITVKEDELLDVDEVWHRKNLFGKIQIIFLIIYLIPAIITFGFLYFALGLAEKVITITIEIVSNFVTWFIKLGDKSESKEF